MAPMPNLGVRPSAIAGTWYPDEPAALRRLVVEMLDLAAPAGPAPGRLLALVSPHAGYMYSGRTAAHAYSQVRGARYGRVVVLGPLHRPIWGSRLGSFMAPAEGAYLTPLGEVPVDQPFLEALAGRAPLTTVRHDEEHSLEIQLPFLQVALAAPFRIAPIMLGAYIGDAGAAEEAERFGERLGELIAERGEEQDTLLVASTDLTHSDSYLEVKRTDGVLLDLLAALDLAGLSRALASGEAQACGATGLIAALSAARALGATASRILAYTCSGDVTGDRRPGAYTVGYVAAGVWAGT